MAFQEAIPHAAPQPLPAKNSSPLKYLSLALPVGYSALFFVGPLVFLVVLGFWVVRNFQIVPEFSLANYIDISRHMFARSNYALAIAQSFYVAITTAIVAVLVCYPMVLAIVFAVPPRWQRLVLLVAIAPFWTSYILRVYAWQILLAKRGIINSAFTWVGIDFQQHLIYTQIATRIGLVHYLAPILLVILYVTVSNIDHTLIEASRELGASSWQAFRRVTLPLSRVGIAVSLSFATIISFGDVLSGSLLGGGAGRSLLGSLSLFSNIIIREYASSTNLPRTSALAMILVVLLVLILVVGALGSNQAQKSTR